MSRLALLPVLLLAAPLGAQGVTAADYTRAVGAAAGYGASNQLYGTLSDPVWQADEQLTYRETTADGWRLMIANPARKTKAPLFDHAAMARTLSAAAGVTYQPATIPFGPITVSANRSSFQADAGAQRWQCQVNASRCTVIGNAAAPAGAAGAGAGARGGQGGRGVVAGGRGGVGGRGGGQGGRGGGGAGGGAAPSFSIRDWNLWVSINGADKQLTTDGVENYGYATNNAGWSTSTTPVVLLSPDAKKVATFQQDERKVGDMYLVSTDLNGGHPTLRAWKYPLPGDSVVAMIERLVIDLETGRMVRFQMPPDYHRSINGDNISMSDMKWSPDGSRIVFASVSRDHKQIWVREANTTTGAIRQIFNERCATQCEGRGGWQVLWETNEIVWMSQRDGWNQLFLYDLASGAVKNKITTRQVNIASYQVDAAKRLVSYSGLGGEPGGDPYFAHHYRVKLDGSGFVSLTPDEGNHGALSWSPSGKYFTTSWSRFDVAPVVTLRDGATGAELVELTRGNTSKMVAGGWHPVTPITMKGRDGVTDIYGVMYTPSGLDPNRKYPIINKIYPGPQGGSVGARNFKQTGGESQGLAELGFIVVEIDGMGATPNRDKAFADAYYGRMGDNSLPDQVTGMQQLAQRYPYIDLSRVGIWGHSGGGFATAAAMFRFPDFFHVGIAESGNHDNRHYEDDWGERYQGLLIRRQDGTDSYTDESNATHAKNLKGKLFLIHGTMDNNVPPNNTLQVVDALIKANKDFDLLMIPNAGHGFGAVGPYVQRLRWDYFVRHLLKTEPPKEFPGLGGATGAPGGRGGVGGPPGGRGGVGGRGGGGGGGGLR